MSRMAEAMINSRSVVPSSPAHGGRRRLNSTRQESFSEITPSFASRFKVSYVCVAAWLVKGPCCFLELVAHFASVNRAGCSAPRRPAGTCTLDDAIKKNVLRMSCLRPCRFSMRGERRSSCSRSLPRNKSPTWFCCHHADPRKRKQRAPL
jgi:hypothetical protein